MNVTEQSRQTTVLIIIHHYLPGQLTGGPVRTTSNMIEWLGASFDFKVITLDRDKGTNHPYPGIQYELWQPVGKAQVKYLRPKEFSFFSLRKVLHEVSYSLIYLDSVLSKPSILILILQRLGLISHKPIIIAPRGHLDRGALSLKYFKKRFFLETAKLFGLYRNVIWHASSDVEKADLLGEFGWQIESRIHVLPNLSMPGIEALTFQTPQKHPGSLCMVYLSRISKKKNLDFILRILERITGQVQFDIYGPIEDSDYWKLCQTMIGQLPSNITVSYKGFVAFDKVNSVLSKYHLFVLPTLGENFGHVILEAVCTGCPVLISDRTPWNDIAEHGAGWAIALQEIEQYQASINHMLALDTASFSQMANNARVYGAQHRGDNQTVQQTNNLLLNVLSSMQVSNTNESIIS